MTILFQAKFLFLVILFSSISCLVKSEISSHCSELYGCQTEDPQERIVKENLNNHEEMILEQRLYDCREHYNRGLNHEYGIFYSEKYNVWVMRHPLDDPDYFDITFDSGMMCPREFNEWVNSKRVDPKIDKKISKITEDLQRMFNKIRPNSSNENDNVFNILLNNTYICADTRGPRIEFEIPGKLNKKQFNFPIKIFKKDRKSFELRRAEGSFNDNVFKGHYYLDSNHIYGDPKVIYGDNKEDWYKVRFTYRSDTNQFIAMISKLTGDVFSCVKK